MAKATVTVALDPHAARVLVVRTSGRDMRGYGGFPWPWRGAVYAPEVWDPAWGEQPEDWVGGFRPGAKAGGGLHGFEWGEGTWSLLSWDPLAWAIVVETDETRVARRRGHTGQLGRAGEIRFSAGNVVAVTSLPEALCRLVCDLERVRAGIASVSGGCGSDSETRAVAQRTALASTLRGADLTSTAALCQLAAAGKGSRLLSSAVNVQMAASGEQSTLAAVGERCTLAAAGARTLLTAAGGRSRLAAAGQRAQMAASADDCALAIAGDLSRAVASGAGCSLAAAGAHSMLAASGAGASLVGSGKGSHLVASGEGSRLAATGPEASLDAAGRGSICMASGGNSRAKAGPNGVIALVWHDGHRPRVTIGYVGEDGIKADTWYKVKDGKLVEQEEWSPWCSRD